jgi:hypothetical protein
VAAEVFGVDSRAPLVRQLCASTTGNNRIQPDKEPLEQAESQCPCGSI